MKTFFCILFTFILLYLFLIRPRLKRPDSLPFQNIFYAHRGLHHPQNNIPENSLTAFSLAAEAGYGIELDVQLSADGVPVIFHDALLGRMCGIDKRVDSLTFSELRALHLLNTQEKIPSLSEVLQLVAGKVPLLVEIKMDHMDFQIPQKIDELLSAYHGPYCIESFHPAALWWYRLHRPDVYRGQLSTHFNVENHTFSPMQFLLGKMVLNIISRPDFISYNRRFGKDLSLFLCRSVFGARCAGWVIRSEKELESSRKTFDMYIFEDFLPQP